MSEDEWLNCDDPRPLLAFLRGKVSDRKLRLFACACWRRVLQLPAKKKGIRRAVDAAERIADQLATPADVATADRFLVAGNEHYALAISSDATAYAIATALHVAERFGYEATATQLAGGISRIGIVFSQVCFTDEKKLQALIIRGIFGNPFRHTSLDPACRTPPVFQLAQSIYDDRNFDQLPILADALEDAGCQDQAILEHLRSPGPHCKGCWPLDLVLGRA